MAKPTPEQLAKINQLAEEEPLTADNAYVHSYLMIGTEYMSRRKLEIDRSLLEIYLKNLQSADVVQIANHSGVLPYGRFFDGEIRDTGRVADLYGTRYMVSGLPTYIQAFSTDDINRMINTGILKDSSVSISWGFSECSICHNDIRDWENCNHWPGGVYKFDGKEEECHVIAKPAQPPAIDSSALHENSDVIAGEYEAAGVNRRRSFSAEGESPPERPNKISLNNIVDLKLVNKDAPVFCCLSSTSATFQIESENLRDASELHQLYHSMYSETELPEGWTKARLSAEHKKVVQALFDEGREHFLVDALDGALNEALKTKSKKGSETIVDEKEKLALEKQITDLTADVQGFTVKIEALEKENGEFKAKVDELTPLAALGTKYREDVIEDAIKAGVRDNAGAEFAEEGLYRKMFETLSIDEIKSFGEKWEASAVAKLGVPAGHTQGEKLELPGSELAQTKDPNLYKVGR
jgi:hypothetical protein